MLEVFFWKEKYITLEVNDRDICGASLPSSQVSGVRDSTVIRLRTTGGPSQHRSHDHSTTATLEWKNDLQQGPIASGGQVESLFQSSLGLPCITQVK